jgi:membrane-associated phospholipid phosphatase
LIGAGLITFTDNEVFDKWEVNEERNAIDPHFRTHVDDYLQYSPAVALYALNAFGMKGRNDLLNSTLLLVKSELLMTAITFPLKAITREPRPDTGAPNSFPSGHTAQAFTAATVLHLEYGKDHPLVSVLGYVTASGIGVLRVMNNRHWICDVLAGAGIGILSTNLAYRTHRYRWGRAPKKYATVLSPIVLSGAIGMNVRVAIH